MFRLRVLTPIALLVTMTTAGCDAGNKKPDDGAAAETKPEAPKPFEGELSFERIESFNRNTSATLYEVSGAPRPWKDALRDVEAKLGKPTWKDGKQLSWGAFDGKRCGYILLEEDQDGKVKMSGGGTGDLDMLPSNLESECRNAAGIPAAEPQEEPITAEPPSVDGKATVEEMLAGAKGNKQAWVGKSLEVMGVYFSTSTVKDDEKLATFVSVSVSKERFKDNIACALAEGETLPDSLLQGTEVVVKGTMRVGGLGAQLENCSLTVPE